MAAPRRGRGKDTDYYWGCCSHHGKKSIVIGLILIVIGLMWAYGYSLPDMLVLIGGILVVKGVLTVLFRKG